MSEKDVARILQVPTLRYKSWEDDQSDIPSKYLFSLTYLYGISYDELLAYEAPDDLDYEMRKSAVKRRYLKGITKLWIAITVIVAIIAISIVTIVNLAPQAHAKYHSDKVYAQMMDNIHKELGDDTTIEDVLYFANENSGIDEENYMTEVVIVPLNMPYMIFYSLGKNRFMYDISEGYLVADHGNITEGEYSVSFEVIAFRNWNYFLIFEDSNTPLNDLVLCYKAYKEAN